jgi:hypothetical protein
MRHRGSERPTNQLRRSDTRLGHRRPEVIRLIEPLPPYGLRSYGRGEAAGFSDRQLGLPREGARGVDPKLPCAASMGRSGVGFYLPVRTRVGPAHGQFNTAKPWTPRPMATCGVWGRLDRLNPRVGGL